jgi:hypothetical protein
VSAEGAYSVEQAREGQLEQVLLVLLVHQVYKRISTPEVKIAVSLHVNDLAINHIKRNVNFTDLCLKIIYWAITVLQHLSKEKSTSNGQILV